MAYEALGAARAEGVDVIVVDHHKCAEVLPPAAALVNPNRLDESDEAPRTATWPPSASPSCSPSPPCARLRARGFFGKRREPDLMALLDLVALGTVADVAQLRGLNRALCRARAQASWPGARTWAWPR